MGNTENCKSVTAAKYYFFRFVAALRGHVNSVYQVKWFFFSDYRDLPQFLILNLYQRLPELNYQEIRSQAITLV